MSDTRRRRSFTWEDPLILGRGIIAAGSHQAWMRELLEGTLPPPPVAEALGMVLERVDDGSVSFSMRTQEWMLNPAGLVHGGFTSTLLDTVLTLAVITQIPGDKICTTLDLNVHFVRPLFATGEKITADGQAVHVGTTVGTSQARIHDERGRLIAHGTATLAIVDIATRSRAAP